MADFNPVKHGLVTVAMVTLADDSQDAFVVSNIVVDPSGALTVSSGEAETLESVTYAAGQWLRVHMKYEPKL